MLLGVCGFFVCVSISGSSALCDDFSSSLPKSHFHTLRPNDRTMELLRNMICSSLWIVCCALLLNEGELHLEKKGAVNLCACA